MLLIPGRGTRNIKAACCLLLYFGATIGAPAAVEAVAWKFLAARMNDTTSVGIDAEAVVPSSAVIPFRGGGGGFSFFEFSSTAQVVKDVPPAAARLASDLGTNLNNARLSHLQLLTNLNNELAVQFGKLQNMFRNENERKKLFPWWTSTGAEVVRHHTEERSTSATGSGRQGGELTHAQLLLEKMKPKLVVQDWGGVSQSTVNGETVPTNEPEPGETVDLETFDGGYDLVPRPQGTTAGSGSYGKVSFYKNKRTGREYAMKCQSVPFRDASEKKVEDWASEIFVHTFLTQFEIARMPDVFDWERQDAPPADIDVGAGPRQAAAINHCVPHLKFVLLGRLPSGGNIHCKYDV
ncbi:unnamed protein product [Amoebophrya sp. A120]|nr:unnamed protein product [Amoebophrya sp. A120]|eukprot:GSA120T00020496001.1